MADSKTPLEAEKYYHIFNHAVGNENLFNSDRNYLYFLEKFRLYISNYADLYAYCLMSNHFHFILKIKSFDVISTEYTKKSNLKESKLKDKHFVPTIMSRQFSHLFNTYAQAYNKENNRKGSLFNNRFKRLHIQDESYLKQAIIYVHNNPVEAGLVKDPGNWKFSSYRSIIEKKSFVAFAEVIELFETLDNFVYCHQ